MPSNISILSFQVKVVPTNFHLDEYSLRGREPALTGDVVELPVAVVRLLINGLEPVTSGSGRPFNARDVLLYGRWADDLELYTCSCGVPGCAGIHDAVRVTRTESQVLWALPLSTYRKLLNGADALDENEYALFTFDRTQYEAALESLEGELLAIAQARPMLQVPPHGAYGCLDEMAFSVSWPKLLADATRRTKAIQVVAEILGDMAQLSLKLNTPAGEFVLSPTQLRAVINPGIAFDENTKQSRTRYKKAAKRMHASLASPMTFVKSLDWGAVALQADYVGANPLNIRFSAVALEGLGENLQELPRYPSDSFVAEVIATWEQPS